MFDLHCSAVIIIVVVLLLLFLLLLLLLYTLKAVFEWDFFFTINGVEYGSYVCVFGLLVLFLSSFYNHCKSFRISDDCNTTATK